MKKKLLISILMVLVISAWVAVPVYAAYLDQPTSKPTIEPSGVKVFRHTGEPNDMAVLFHWKIPYFPPATYPTTPSSMSVVFRFYATDGVTLLKTVQPYVYSLFATNGYGDGISMFYFPASDNMTWGAAYIINIMGWPTYFSPAINVNYTLSSAEYDSNTTQAENRADMYNCVMQLCDTFKAIYPAAPLKSITDAGVLLSIYGDTYFKGCALGIDTLCPTLFYYQQHTPTQMPVQSYNMTLQTVYSGRLSGRDIETGATRIGALFGGVSGKFIESFAVIAGAIIALVLITRKGWGLEAGMFVATGIGVCGAVLVGDALFGLLIVGVLLLSMYLIWHFYQKRA